MSGIESALHLYSHDFAKRKELKGKEGKVRSAKPKERSVEATFCRLIYPSSQNT